MTDGLALSARDRTALLTDKIRRAVEAGVDWIQLREKDLEGRELLKLADAAVRLARELSGERARVIVNDRADVAIAARADGVHLGGKSATVIDVAASLRRGAATEDFLIGVSCHAVEEVRAAEDGGADYVFLGPIFDTPAKRLYGAPLGLARLEDACRTSTIPVIAIGGIDLGRIALCLEAGAAGVAAIRLFQEQDSAKAREAVEKIHRVNG